MSSEIEMVPAITTRREEAQGFLQRMVSKSMGWARKYSLFQYPFVTACCGMEYMTLASARYDLDRFGAALPRFSPRQADLLMVVGTVNVKQAPILKRVYEQMADPKWVIAFGVCASSGGFYDNYATVQGIDRVIPVDVYVPGCPPRPEALLYGIRKLQERIQEDRVLRRKGMTLGSLAGASLAPEALK
jgi:NADH-quinone oxidoreductase subunit B